MTRIRDSQWILDGRKPVRVATIEEQVRWLMDGGEAQRRVARTEIGDLTVSTVFMGVELTGGSDDRPCLFETMVQASSPEHGSWQRFHRYATWDEAQAGHDSIVAFAKSRIERGESMDPDAFGEMTILQAFLSMVRG